MLWSCFKNLFDFNLIQQMIVSYFIKHWNGLKYLKTKSKIMLKLQKVLHYVENVSLTVLNLFDFNFMLYVLTSSSNIRKDTIICFYLRPTCLILHFLIYFKFWILEFSIVCSVNVTKFCILMSMFNANTAVILVRIIFPIHVNRST